MKTRLRLLWALSWLCLFGAACSTSEKPERDDEGSQAGAAIRFCEEYYNATCQQLWRCSCSERALEVCEYQIETCSKQGFFLSLEEGIAKGWLRYDASGANALLARLTGAPEACENQFVVLGFDSINGHTFGGAFAGTLEAGRECGDEPDAKALPGVSYCREGLLCLPGADHVNRCVPIAGPGERCPIVPSTPGSSCYERRPVDPDGTLTSAQIDLVCVPDGPESQTGTCERNAPQETACDDDAQCASGFCRTSESQVGVPGTCDDRRANAEECSAPNACDSGRCDFSQDPPICAEPSPEGDDCLIAEDCASGNCVYGTAEELLGSCRPAASPLPPGAECGPAGACAGGRCADGLCRQPICTTYDI